MKFIPKRCSVAASSRVFPTTSSDWYTCSTACYFPPCSTGVLAETNLLSSAEQAGLRPQHGCRMGVCNKCSCTKVSGVTQNLLTGEIEDQPNRPIKLCVSQALSPVTIDL